eukprot:627801-Prymnesium_polylepis.1
MAARARWSLAAPPTIRYSFRLLGSALFSRLGTFKYQELVSSSFNMYAVATLFRNTKPKRFRARGSAPP